MTLPTPLQITALSTVFLAACTSVRTHHPPPVSERTVPQAIHYAFSYLEESQVTAEQEQKSQRKVLAGEWPQFIGFGSKFGWYKFRDTNSFTPSVIAHTLGHLTERNAKALHLNRHQLRSARSSRIAAIRFLDHFLYRKKGPALHSYGYWPPARPVSGWQSRISRFLSSIEDTEPRFFGDLAPISLPIFPSDYYIWPDSDTTAACHRALFQHRKLDGKIHPVARPDLSVYSRYLDRRSTKRYAPESDVLPKGSNTFLTWFPPASAPDCLNEIDLVVNAHVLVVLGAQNRLDYPGAREAIAWINRAIRSGHQHDPRRVTTHYQHPWLVHAAVANAYREGRIRQLKPAVDLLRREVVASAIRHPDGRVSWEGPSPVLATTAAAGVLLDTGSSGALLDGAVRYLVDAQKKDGSWHYGWVHMGSDDDGMTWKVKSTAGFTSQTMDVLCRYILSR